MVNDIILSGMAWASSLRNAIANHMKDEGGQDLIEYAVLAGAISLVGAAAILFWGDDITTAMETFGGQVANCLSLEETGACG